MRISKIQVHFQIQVNFTKKKVSNKWCHSSLSPCWGYAKNQCLVFCMLVLSGGVISKTQSWVLTVTSFIYIWIPAPERRWLKEMEVTHSFRFIIKTQVPSCYLASLPQESHPTSSCQAKLISYCVLPQACYSKYSRTWRRERKHLWSKDRKFDHTYVNLEGCV